MADPIIRSYLGLVKCDPGCTMWGQVVSTQCNNVWYGYTSVRMIQGQLILSATVCNSSLANLGLSSVTKSVDKLACRHLQIIIYLWTSAGKFIWGQTEGDRGWIVDNCEQLTLIVLSLSAHSCNHTNMQGIYISCVHFTPDTRHASCSMWNRQVNVHPTHGMKTEEITLHSQQSQCVWLYA